MTEKTKIRITDYDTYSVDMKCPICDSHDVEGYFFHGTWIYVCEDCNFLGIEYRDKRDLENLKLFEKLRSTPVSKIRNYRLESKSSSNVTTLLGETVKDFAEVYYPSVWELNKDLVLCDIKPIEKFKN